MNRKSFWSLIDHARAAAGGDPRRQVGTLEQALMQLTPDEVLGFDRHFCTLHARADTPGLWGAAQVIGGSCSDDGFADFRGWLIARGKRVYEQALADPDTLAGVVGADDADCQVEGFEYLARGAWAALTGQPEEDFPGRAPVAVEAAADEEADWSHPGQLAARFPALWRIFGVRQAVPGAAPTPARQSVVTETLGEIRCGDTLVHARFGACVVEALEPAGRTVTLTLRFGAARKHMVLMPGQTYLTRAAVA